MNSFWFGESGSSLDSVRGQQNLVIGLFQHTLLLNLSYLNLSLGDLESYLFEDAQVRLCYEKTH